jgi:hypothetical protein
MSLSVVSIMIAGGTLMFSVITYGMQRTQADFALALRLHTDLTTGEVAQARDILGTIVHTGMRTDQVDLAEARAAYFTLMWSLERIEAGRRTIARGWFGRRALRFLNELVDWHVAYWADNRQPVKEALEAGLGAEIDDEEVRAGFDSLVIAVTGRPRARAS